MNQTTIRDRRQTGDTGMTCDAVDNGVPCPDTQQLYDIGGDSFVGSGVRFVVKHRLCARHRDMFARTRVLIERC